MPAGIIIAVVLVLGLTLLQIVATLAGILYLFGPPPFVAAFLTILVAPWPVIGTAFGIVGARYAWGWSWLSAFMLFFGLGVVAYGTMLSGGLFAILRGRYSRKGATPPIGQYPKQDINRVENADAVLEETRFTEAVTALATRVKPQEWFEVLAKVGGIESATKLLGACRRQCGETPSHPGVLLLAGLCEAAASTEQDGSRAIREGFSLLKRQYPNPEHRLWIAMQLTAHAKRLCMGRVETILLAILGGDPSFVLAKFCQREVVLGSEACRLATSIVEQAAEEERPAREEQAEERERIERLSKFVEAFVKRFEEGSDREREHLMKFLTEEGLIAEEGNEPQRSIEIGLAENFITAIRQAQDRNKKSSEYDLFKRHLTATTQVAQEPFAGMSGEEFEEYVARCFERMRAKVGRTPRSKDYGVDLIATHQGREIAIQVKRSVSPVGIQAVQEVAAGARHYACNEAAVICNSSFTKSAEGLAATARVQLITATDPVHLEQQVELFLGGERRAGEQ